MKNLKLWFGATLVVVFCFAYVYVSAFSPESGVALATEYKLVLATGAASGVTLWVWMFSDFFRRKDLGYKILWGWLLFFANMLAAAIYFAFIYFPREYRKQ